MNNDFSIVTLRNRFYFETEMRGDVSSNISGAGLEVQRSLFFLTWQKQKSQKISLWHVWGDLEVTSSFSRATVEWGKTKKPSPNETELSNYNPYFVFYFIIFNDIFYLNTLPFRAFRLLYLLRQIFILWTKVSNFFIFQT